MKSVLVVSLALFASSAVAVTEDFTSATWLHHEDLGNNVVAGDLRIEVPAGASLKGVREPFALQPGYDPTRPATVLTITPDSGAVFSVQRVGLTDLFGMDMETIMIAGFRDGELISSQSAGPLWQDVTMSGLEVVLSGFNSIDRLTLSSDVLNIDDSDVHFFLESVTYDLTTDVTPDTPSPSPENPDNPTNNAADDEDDSSGGSMVWALLASALLFRRRSV